MIEYELTEKGTELQAGMDFGTGCIGCPASQAESIKQAVAVHGIDVEKLLKRLNQIK